ncbi:MAG: photosynthetic complex assembly protein PuhC [Pseudomonadota bacterium]
MIPPWAGAAGGIVMIVVLVATTIATVTRDSVPVEPGGGSPMVASRLVAFESTDEGVLVVRDADTGDQISSLLESDGGFLHNLVAVLSKQRRRHAVDTALPYQLSAHTNGRVSIRDPATGRVIDINAFGANQVETFAALLRVAS